MPTKRVHLTPEQKDLVKQEFLKDIEIIRASDLYDKLHDTAQECIEGLYDYKKTQ